MNPLAGQGIAFLVIGVVAGLIVVVQFKRGATFGPQPAVRFNRGTDPFGFWLHVAITGAVAIFFAASGLAILFHIGPR
jgi:hypothetical protein